LNTSRELYRLSPESGCAGTVGVIAAVHTKEQVRARKKKRVGFIRTSFDKVLLLMDGSIGGLFLLVKG
jgi:hypothetical protein